MALITMVMIHIYFALRPDEWHLTRSMFRGWMTRKEYQDHFDPKRWNASDESCNPGPSGAFALPRSRRYTKPSPFKRSFHAVRRCCAHRSGRGH